MTPPARTTSILLEHTLPDGTTHYDWLIERPGDTRQHRMITFRCDTDPLAPDARNAWRGNRLPDHRSHYILHEGPVSGGRGGVRRVWSYPCIVIDEAEHAVVALLHVEKNGSERSIPFRIESNRDGSAGNRWILAG